MPEETSPILSSIKNIFSIPDLRTRVLFMLGLLAVYRVGAFIPTPGINHDALEQLFQAQAGTIFGFLDIFSGGNLRRFSIFALGIMPYITASIILQLATVVVPYLEKLSKEGELGRKQDHPVHPLPDRRAHAVPGLHDGDRAGTHRAVAAVRRSCSIPAGISGSW